MTDDTRRSVNTFLGSRPGREGTKTSRGILSILTLIMGGGLIYTSLPYASAFVNVGKIIGVSQLDRGIETFKSDLTRTAKVKKVYLRQGQALRASYALPKGSTLKLSILRCQSRPIIKVYSCAPVSRQYIKINDTTSGSRTFAAPEAGFYFFQDEMTLPATGQSPYTLLWQRT